MGGTCSPERAPSSRGAWRRHVAPRSVSSGAQRPRLWRRPVVVFKSPDSGELPPRRPVALPRRAPGVPRRPPVLRPPRVACKFAVSAFNAGRLRPRRSPPLTASSSWSLSATGCCSPDGDACCWTLAGVRAGSPARAGIADNPRTNAVTTKNLMVFSLPVGKTCNQEFKRGRLPSARRLDARHLEDVLGTDGCSAEDAVAEDVGLDDRRYVDRNVHGNWFDMDVQRRCHVHRDVHQDERVTRLHLIELGIAQPVGSAVEPGCPAAKAGVAQKPNTAAITAKYFAIATPICPMTCAPFVTAARYCLSLLAPTTDGRSPGSAPG